MGIFLVTLGLFVFVLFLLVCICVQLYANVFFKFLFLSELRQGKETYSSHTAPLTIVQGLSHVAR